MQITNMTAKDQKIIDANPGADFYTLTEKGLSNKGAQEWLQLQPQQTNKLKATKVEVIQDYIAQPQLSHQPYIGNSKQISDEVQILNLKNPHAVPRGMTRTAATNLVKKYPSEFKIIG